jgi:hypothetical protein
MSNLLPLVICLIQFLYVPSIEKGFEITKNGAEFLGLNYDRISKQYHHSFI